MYRTKVAPAAALLLLLLTCRCFWRQTVRAQDGPPAAGLGRQEVTADVDDRHSLAVTTVRQEFINPTGREVPGSCLLPLSDQAALMRVRVLEPRKPPPAHGRPPEEDIRIEAADHYLYRLTYDHVPARGKARVELVYAEALTRRGDRRKYIYPILHGGSGAAGLTAHVRIEAAGVPERVSCTTHRMAVRRPGPHVVELSYQGRTPPEGRDLVVDYALPDSESSKTAALAVFTPGDREPYFLLSLPEPAALLRGAGAGQPADVVFCLDVSGSTSGRKLNAIQEAVCDGLADLSPRDRIGVVAFDDDARAFRRSLVPAGQAEVAAAVRFINRLRPAGGTDPERALRAALGILGKHPGERRLRAIAVVTDDTDTADLAAVAGRLGIEKQGIRLVALGAMADSRLVHFRIAGRKLGRGPAVALSRAVVTCGPVLAGASLDAGPLNASYVYPVPERLPDLPLSTPVVLMGRLDQAPPARGTVKLDGKVDGKPVSLAVEYTWQPLDPGSPVPALWANRRVARLQRLAARDERHAQELEQAAGRVQAEHALAGVPRP